MARGRIHQLRLPFHARHGTRFLIAGRDFDTRENRRLELWHARQGAALHDRHQFGSRRIFDHAGSRHAIAHVRAVAIALRSHRLDRLVLGSQGKKTRFTKFNFSVGSNQQIKNVCETSFLFSRSPPWRRCSPPVAPGRKKNLALGWTTLLTSCAWANCAARSNKPPFLIRPRSATRPASFTAWTARSDAPAWEFFKSSLFQSRRIIPSPRNTSRPNRLTRTITNPVCFRIRCSTRTLMSALAAAMSPRSFPAAASVSSIIKRRQFFQRADKTLSARF